jgi:hypothetical protein
MSGTAVPPWRDADGRILKLAHLARDEFEAQHNVIAILNNGGDRINLEVGSEPFGVHLLLVKDPDRKFAA